MLPIRVDGPRFRYTRFGFSPQAIFRPYGRPGELHLLHGARGNEFEDGAPPADQVRRSRQRLDGRDSARDRERDLRILRPERMLGPDLRRHRIGRLVAVGFGIGARGRVHPQVRMVVDDPGRHVLARPVDHHRIGGRFDRRPDADDAPVAKQDRAARDLLPGGGHDGGIADQHRRIRVSPVGRGVLRPLRAGRLGDGRRSGCLDRWSRARRGAGRDEGQGQHPHGSHRMGLPRGGDHFTSSKTKGAPTSSIFTMRRGVSLVT